MSHGWPATIDPIQLAMRGERLAGGLPLRQMRRLAELCVDDEGEFDVELNFTHSEAEDLLEMSGRVRGEVRVVCQRCLEPMRLPLEANVRLTLLRPGEREDPLQEAEALVVDKPMPVAALVEDELLLAMPMIPMHAVQGCPAGRHLADGRKTAPRRSPFAALAEKKAGRGSDR